MDNRVREVWMATTAAEIVACVRAAAEEFAALRADSLPDGCDPLQVGDAADVLRLFSRLSEEYLLGRVNPYDRFLADFLVLLSSGVGRLAEFSAALDALEARHEQPGLAWKRHPLAPRKPAVRIETKRSLDTRAA